MSITPRVGDAGRQTEMAFKTLVKVLGSARAHPARTVSSSHTHTGNVQWNANREILRVQTALHVTQHVTCDFVFDDGGVGFTAKGEMGSTCRQPGELIWSDVDLQTQ